jgi:hypothetical protein
VKRLSFPKRADDTFAMRLSIESDGLTAEIDMILVCVGGALMSIAHMGLMGVDSTVTEGVARTAVQSSSAPAEKSAALRAFRLVFARCKLPRLPSAAGECARSA